ncbi:MAG TPA: hypothetical protein VE440_03745 [Gaiellaceae bacterium]|jgi:hypothetical protein|nr:hypothetical protein [Gaiellaceae bacterium]
MLVEAQTVVLLGRATGFTAVCDACVEEQLAELLDDSWVGASVSGSLGLEHDRGWASCAQGHRVRVIRAGRTADGLFH